MLDFGLSPPEIISTQIYAGPGSESMIVAASAWDALAAQLASFVQGYSAVLTSLEGQHWTGSAASAMAAAAAPYVQWASTTAGQAEQASSQARATAAAFETAHAAVVPPALVAANRNQLADLIATNVLGQNAPHIAATEAAYTEMWAQDTQAMNGYAASASTTTRLSPFKAPPQTTNPAGQSAQAAVVAAQAADSGASHANSLSEMISAVPQQLLAGPTPAGTSSLFGLPVSSSMLSSIGDFNTAMGPINALAAFARTFGNLGTFSISSYRLANDFALYAPLAGLTGAASPVTFGGIPSGALAGVASAPRAVLASAANAGLVGPLSVPHAWVQATPVAAVGEQPLWLSEVESWWEAGAPATVGTETMAEVAAAAAAGTMLMRPVVGKALRVPPRRFKMSSSKSGG